MLKGQRECVIMCLGLTMSCNHDGISLFSRKRSNSSLYFWLQKLCVSYTNPNITDTRDVVSVHRSSFPGRHTVADERPSDSKGPTQSHHAG